MIYAFHFDRLLARCACCVTALALALSLSVSAAAAAPAENVLRLHVIANSDSAEDQRVKLLVRDALLSLMPETADAKEAEAYVRANGKTLLAAAERTLIQNGFPYGAQLALGTFPFPDRTYNGTAFPAGDYRALRVVLGRGSGQNWWCVLFPPLCIVTRDEEPLPETDEITFESSILTRIRAWRDGR